MTKVSVRRLVRIALFAAVLCLIAPVRVDIGPVPITLQTLFIALAGAILGCADGTICLAIYLLMGLCGLPSLPDGRAAFQLLQGRPAAFCSPFRFWRRSRARVASGRGCSAWRLSMWWARAGL